MKNSALFYVKSKRQHSQIILGKKAAREQFFAMFRAARRRQIAEFAAFVRLRGSCRAVCYDNIKFFGCNIFKLCSNAVCAVTFISRNVCRAVRLIFYPVMTECRLNFFAYYNITYIAFILFKSCCGTGAGFEMIPFAARTVRVVGVLSFLS